MLVKFKEVKEHVTSTITPLQVRYHVSAFLFHICIPLTFCKVLFVSSPQLAGGVGDVIFTHGRTFHMGSRNLSSQIRQAIFYDVVKKEVDARFHSHTDDQGSPDRSLEMWHDWSDEVRAASGY
jgi:hypothetical protein